MPMARRAARTIRHNKAMELLRELSGQADTDYAAQFHYRAYVLSDGRFLTEIWKDRSWNIWDSKSAWEAVMARAASAPEVINPVKGAIGDLPRFLEECGGLARQLVQIAKVRHGTGGLDETVDAVEAFVRKRSGAYWLDDMSNLRMLIAYIGEVLHERCEAKWIQGESAPGMMALPSGRQVDVVREITAQADEAPKGAFSIRDVLRELGG